MGYKEKMIAYAGRLGVRAFGELSLPELAKRIESDPEPATPRTRLYAYMTWLSDHLQEINNSDEDVFSREIATWCLFVNDIGFDRDNVVGTFEEWVHEHSEVERSSARRLSMAELEVKKFYCIPTETPQSVLADEHHQPSPPVEQTSQQFSPVNEASEAQHVGGFGHIHPDRLKLSKYGDSNLEKGEVIDLDQRQCPVFDISSDAILKSKTDLSFLTGANRMVFGDDETNLNTDIKETKRSKKKSNIQVMQPGPTSGQTKKKNKNPCGRCGVPGHYHMQCPTNLDPLFDKSPPYDYKCNLCSKCGDHYATVCKRNMNPASLNQQRKRHAGKKYHSLPSRGRSRSPLREPKDKRHTRMERSSYRMSKDRHCHSRESSPHRLSETRYHVERNISRERKRRRRSRSRYRSPSPPRQALRRRDRHQNNKMYWTKHSSPEPKFEEQDSSSPPQFEALDYDDGFDHMPDQPYRPMIPRPADVKIRGRGSSFYYDTNGEGPMQPAFGDGDLMSRKRCRSETPVPHQDDRVGRLTVNNEFFLTELTELIATTTVSPRLQAPVRNRLPGVFKNDLRQPSWSWDSAPTDNTTLIKPEPVPDVVREPSPPVELGVTEKRLDDRHATQYHPAILELLKNRKNIWIHKIGRAMRPQASSFFWDKDLEENDMDASAHPDVAVEIESTKDTVMIEAEPVAPPIDEADAVDTVKIESEPVVMTDTPQRADLTSTIDVVMENSVTMQIIQRNDDNPRTQQSSEDIRGDLKPADDIVMEDAEPLHVSAIVNKIIANMGLPEAANTAPEPVEKGSPPVESATNSKTLLPAQKTILVQEIVNEALAAVSSLAEAATSTGALTSRETVLVQETVHEASAESADIVPEANLNHALTADDNDTDTLREGTQDDGDNISSDTVIKDVIYVKIAPEPKPAETAAP